MDVGKNDAISDCKATGCEENAALHQREEMEGPKTRPTSLKKCEHMRNFSNPPVHLNLVLIGKKSLILACLESYAVSLFEHFSVNGHR